MAPQYCFGKCRVRACSSQFGKSSKTRGNYQHHHLTSAKSIYRRKHGGRRLRRTHLSHYSTPLLDIVSPRLSLRQILNLGRFISQHKKRIANGNQVVSILHKIHGCINSASHGGITEGVSCRLSHGIINVNPRPG